MRLSQKILFFLGAFSIGMASAGADEAAIFIDPSDPALIRRTEIPLASTVLLNASELPTQSLSHPKILFGEQKFSYLQVSPDGQTLAFSVDGEASDWSGLYDLGSKKITEVSLSFDSKALAPYWSGDGRKVAFESEDPNGRRILRIYDVDQASICALDGRAAKNKYFDLHRPFWSDDGGKLYFQVDVNNAYRRSMGLKPIVAATRIGEAGVQCQGFVLRSVEKFMAEVPLKSLPPEAMALSPQGSP
ncbi:MAG TPA: hypothetical protein VJP40_00110 [bacterium]|nr:hypothetical protein [bacterium]